jgi:hypothetical protein
MTHSQGSVADVTPALSEPVQSQVQCGADRAHQVYKIKTIAEDGIVTKLDKRLDYGYCCQCQMIIAEPHRPGVN